MIYSKKFSIENLPGIEKAISANVARLSPVQWAVNWPEPANVERDKTNGRFLRIVFNAL
jgi:hypothetical protein